MPGVVVARSVCNSGRQSQATLCLQRPTPAGQGEPTAGERARPLPPGAVPGSAACAAVRSTSGIVGHHSTRVCSPPVKARRYSPPRCRELAALTPAPRMLPAELVRRCRITTPPHATAVMLDRATPIRRSVPAPRPQRARMDQSDRRGHDDRIAETTRARLLDSRPTWRAASS